MYASAAAAPAPNAVTIADYASDVRTWVAEVRRLTGTACVWLLGHSERGLVALAAAQAESGICGLLRLLNRSKARLPCGPRQWQP
jgi:uncharacterized protein